MVVCDIIIGPGKREGLRRLICRIVEINPPSVGYQLLETLGDWVLRERGPMMTLQGIEQE